MNALWNFIDSLIKSMQNAKLFMLSAKRGVLFFLVMTFSVCYLLLTRHWKEFLVYSFIIGLPFAYRLAFREIAIYYKQEETFWWKLKFYVRAYLPISFFATIWGFYCFPLGLSIYGILAASIDMLYWLTRELSEHSISTALGVVVTAIIGIALFLMRLKFRCLYGCSEFAVGLMVAGFRLNSEVSSEINPSLILALLTAGAYLVVRGLDNVHQGWKAKSDPFANYLLRIKNGSSNSEE